MWLCQLNMWKWNDSNVSVNGKGTCAVIHFAVNKCSNITRWFSEYQRVINEINLHYHVLKW